MKHLLGRIMVVVALILPFAAAAESDGIAIERPWSRATFATTGAAYLTIMNRGETADALIAVSSPLANKVSVHKSLMEDGIMKMRPALPVELAAGEAVKLAPGGLHVMLMGLAAPLVEGAMVPIALTFRNAGAIDVQARIGPAGAPNDGQGGD